MKNNLDFSGLEEIFGSKSVTKPNSFDGLSEIFKSEPSKKVETVKPPKKDSSELSSIFKSVEVPKSKKPFNGIEFPDNLEIKATPKGEYPAPISKEQSDTRKARAVVEMSYRDKGEEVPLGLKAQWKVEDLKPVTEKAGISGLFALGAPVFMGFATLGNTLKNAAIAKSKGEKVTPVSAFTKDRQVTREYEPFKKLAKNETFVESVRTGLKIFNKYSPMIPEPNKAFLDSELDKVTGEGFLSTVESLAELALYSKLSSVFNLKVKVPFRQELNEIERKTVQKDLTERFNSYKQYSEPEITQMVDGIMRKAQESGAWNKEYIEAVKKKALKKWWKKQWTVEKVPEFKEAFEKKTGESLQKVLAASAEAPVIKPEVPIVPKVSPLEVEAKKFKTAEDFVESKEIVFHGQGATHPTKGGKITGGITSNLKGAQAYAGFRGEGSDRNETGGIIRVIRLSDLNVEQQKIIKEGGNISAMDYKQEIDSIATLNATTAKQELTDIWNKAQKPVEAPEVTKAPIATIGDGGTSVLLTPKPTPIKMNVRELKEAKLLTDDQLLDALKKAVSSHAKTIRGLSQFTGFTYEELLTPKGNKIPGEFATTAFMEMENYKFDPDKHEINKWLNDNTQAAVKRTIKKLRVSSNNVTDADHAAKYKKAEKDLIKENGVEPTVKEIADKAQFLKDPKKNLEKAWDIKELMNTREGKVSLESITEHGYEPGEEPEEEYFEKMPGVLPEPPEVELPTEVEMPEILKLAKELLKNDVEVKKMFKALGYFKFANEMALGSDIFTNEKRVAKIITHEIGHVVNKFSEILKGKNVKRGNMIGYLLSLEGFLKKTFGELDNVVLRDELKALTMWWNPFTPKKDDKYTKYRFSSNELYAEAISVMLNHPKIFEKKAPIFAEAFYKNLDKKIPVKEALIRLNEFLILSPEDKFRVRTEDIHSGYIKAQGLLEQLHARRNLQKKSLWHWAKFAFSDKYTALLEVSAKLKKKGVIVHPEDDPLFFMSEFTYMGGKIKNLYNDITNYVLEPLFQVGMTIETIGDDLNIGDSLSDLLLYNRVLGQRANIANPHALAPTTATTQREGLRKKLGDEKFNALDKGVKVLRQLMEGLITKVRETGAIDQATYERIMLETSYAPFQIADHIADNIAPGIIKQQGTLKDVSNVFISYVLKMKSMIRFIERVKVYNKTVNFLKTHVPGEIMKAPVKYVDKEIVTPYKEGYGIIKTMEEGKHVAYYVDPYIADAINKSPSDKSIQLLSSMLWLNKSWFKPLYITFNPTFQARNFVMDFFRGWLLNYHVTLPRFIFTYAKALPTAAKRIWGKNIPKTIYDMQQGGMLSTTYYELISGKDYWTDDEVETQMLLKKYKIIEDKGVNNWFTKALHKSKILPTAQFIAECGEFVETWSKVVGYLTRLDSLKKGKISIEELAHEVRNYGGSPSFLTYGGWTAYTNQILMFSNPTIQGTKSEIEGAFRNPRTRTGYWMKMAGLVVVPALLAYGAQKGLYGKKVARLYGQITEYNKTNYNCIILGEDEGGRTIYWRVPLPHVARAIHGLIWKGLAKEDAEQGVIRTLADMAGPLANNLPSISPTVELYWKFSELFGRLMLRSNSPIYSNADRVIVSREELQAANKYPMEIVRNMTKFVAGMSNLGNLYAKDGETPLQKAIKKIPVAETFIKVSRTAADIKNYEKRNKRYVKMAERKVGRKIKRRK